jgi:endonuclease/exonuclease/phosphatase (EEP) superfamily protein YafD
MGTSAKRWGRRLLRLAYGLAALLTLGGLAAPWVPPRWIPEWQALAVLLPLTLPAHAAAALLFRLLGLRREALAALLLALLCLWPLSKEYGLPGRSDDPALADLNVLSHNVAAFRLNPRQAEQLARMAKARRPDLVCLQEFRNLKTPSGERVLDYLSRELALPYRAFPSLRENIHGVALLSRLPILRIDTLFASTEEINSGFLFTLGQEGDTLGVAVLHLSSFHLPRRLLRNQPWRMADEATVQHSSDVIHRQSGQAERCLALLDAYPHPLLIAGDFNAVPHSWVSAQFAARYQDSFQAGEGWGWTLPLTSRWGLRIDYQYASKHWQPLAHEVIPGGRSDHFPLIAAYARKKGAGSGD